MPQHIALYELIRRAHNSAAGAVILFHQQYFGAAVFLLKVEERLRIRRAEPVNALVLVSDHKKIVVSGGQQGDDSVLDPGRVLRLIHADVLVLILEVRQHLRHLAQNVQGVHHLIVVIHQMLLPQPPVIALINLPDIDLAVRLPQGAPLVAAQLADLLLRQHLVFDVRDQRPHIPKVRLRRPGLLHLLINLGQNTGRPLLIRHQLKGFLSQHPAVVADDPGADPVDGPKLQPRSQFLAKKARKPAGHVARSGNRISHGQNILRLNSTVRDHVAQPQHQHRGLAASRHSQQKHRPVDRLHCLRLLWVEHDSASVLLRPDFRILVCHTSSFYVSSRATSGRLHQRLSTASGFFGRRVLPPGLAPPGLISDCRLPPGSCRTTSSCSLRPSPTWCRACRNCTRDRSRSRPWAETARGPRYTWGPSA